MKRRAESQISAKASALASWGSTFVTSASRRGKWQAYYTPKLKKRTALLRKLKDVFRRHRSQPVNELFS